MFFLNTECYSFSNQQLLTKIENLCINKCILLIFKIKYICFWSSTHTHTHTHEDEDRAGWVGEAWELDEKNE